MRGLGGAGRPRVGEACRKGSGLCLLGLDSVRISVNPVSSQKYHISSGAGRSICARAAANEVLLQTLGKIDHLPLPLSDG